MKTFTLRVIPETEEIIYRDLIVSEKTTFLEVHHLLLKAFEFSNDQMASFYISDEDWNKGQEIALFNMGDEQIQEMEQTPVGSVFSALNQKMLYTYDFLAMWNFTLEVMEIGEVESEKGLPKVGRRYGDSPDQQAKKVDGSDAESILVSAMFGDGDGEYDALFGEDEDDLFNDDRFESLDDHDDFH